MIGNPWGPLAGSFAGLTACAIIAAIFGYFVFYARVQMWIAPILTLVFTLLLETFLGQTAGYQWRIGSVQLGGYNGMTGIPSFQLGNFVFFGYSFYYYVLIVALVCFLVCRMLVSSRHGHVLLAIREDPLRTELLGYDIRARQLVVFVIAAVLAGISGLLYVQWGNYITPTQVGLLQAALPVIWVAVGGRDSLIAVAISHVPAELAHLCSILRRQSVRTRHYRRAAGVCDAVLPERNHRDPGPRTTASRMAHGICGALTMAEILATEALAKRFGGVVATDNVTLKVIPGELRCIIGPNGAGKSTLFALLCGIHRPDAGRVLLKGQDVTFLPAFRRVRLGVGLTFQTNRAYHHLTVRQNLEAPLRPVRHDQPKDAQERFLYALKLFGLDPMSDIPARELPHDQLQWLEIAMVLAGGPDILLLG